MTELRIRKATEADVPAIVALLADDPLGAGRESPDDLTPYLRAFAAIEADANQLLVVAERDGRTVGTLQLSLLPGLTRRGAARGQIEAVRVARDERGSGLGAALMQWAIDEAHERGCQLVQLTSDVSRSDAHRFYERLGFVPTHVGFKLNLVAAVPD
ncbi:GNAT family N-acetyltransferase [Dactylosporangium darangshiense]|uniref:GNAT family N-acetyltransferase n=1 Tax=Dactylosporangium darangshiense TaxID=579108 RepID=A0ABP8DB97_9ACTN